MFEDRTYESILQQMLDGVTAPVDKREGSIIWDALAPAAAELQLMYIALDVILRETFADTASREYLIKRAAERGLSPHEATYAILRGRFNTGVPIGARFSLELLNYIVIERMEDGDYRLQCETAGAEGNRYLGTLIPIEYISGLQSAELVEVLIPGEDEEGTEALRQRYFASLDTSAYGGNIKDYKNKVKELQAVGGVKVYPVWNGGGTVRLVIIDSMYQTPTGEFLDQLQTLIDPEQNQGEGLGVAPIGHTVTVEGVREIPVHISIRITYMDGYNWARIETAAAEALEEYFLGLREQWEDSRQLVVRISHIETRLLSLDGVLDVEDTAINGRRQNLILGSDDVPVRGDLLESAG